MQLKNNTAQEMPSSNFVELAHEQDYVSMLYERLDALRAATSRRLSAVRLDPTAENDHGRWFVCQAESLRIRQIAHVLNAWNVR